MLERLAQESGIETPTAEDLARLDRKRKGKKLSNQDWLSRSDPEAKIAKMKDGTTHLAYKPEHAVDLDTGAVVAAELHPADEGDTTTLPKTLAAAEANLEAVDVAPTAEDPAECVTDKGYHSRLVLKALDDGPWKSRISEPKAERLLRNLARRLEHDAPGVSGSILEGMDEILTVIRLGLPPQLRRSLACTNAIENAIGTVRTVQRNVKRWRNAEMALRWTAAGLLEAQKTFRRLNAYHQLPILDAALREAVRKAGAKSVIEDIEVAA